MTIQGIKVLTVVCLLISVNYLQLSSHYITKIKKKVSKKDAFFFCYAARLLSIFIFKTSLVFSIIPLREVILQK